MKFCEEMQKAVNEICKRINEIKEEDERYQIVSTLSLQLIDVTAINISYKVASLELNKSFLIFANNKRYESQLEELMAKNEPKPDYMG
jgi:hypothetical protein